MMGLIEFILMVIRCFAVGMRMTMRKKDYDFLDFQLGSSGSIISWTLKLRRGFRMRGFNTIDRKMITAVHCSSDKAVMCFIAGPGLIFCRVSYHRKGFEYLQGLYMSVFLFVHRFLSVRYCHNFFYSNRTSQVCSVDQLEGRVQRRVSSAREVGAIAPTSLRTWPTFAFGCRLR